VALVARVEGGPAATPEPYDDFGIAHVEVALRPRG
jgi:hypothetical protein